jgi:type II secretory pathway pseudopilin PulG
MVVVVLVAILAAVAVPGVVDRLRERRASEAAQRIASLYRTARIRALGRGAATLVRWEDSGFTIYEAVQGAGAPSAGCALQPVSSCLTPNWANSGASTRHQVGQFSVQGRGEYTEAGVAVAVTGPTGAAATTLDVCFSPLGQAYSRTDLEGAFSPLIGVVGATVKRSTIAGITHRIAVLPNGIAAVSASGP